MSLQVRVRHALGEQIIDLPDRGADNPLIVGKSRDADVKIPSVAVASRHGALFVHNGRWVAQDLSKGATYINGKVAQGPTALSVGDVLRLGDDANPPTIEIDPARAAAGRGGKPALTSEARPVSRPRGDSPQRTASTAQRQAPSPTSSPPRPTAPQITQSAPPPAPPDDPWAATATPADDPFAGWQPPAPGTTTSRPRKRQSSATGWIAGILVCALIVGGTIWAVHYETRLKAAAVQSAKVEALSNDPHKRVGNIFTGVDATEKAPARQPATNSTGDNGSAKPMPKPPSDGAPDGNAPPPALPPVHPPSVAAPPPDAAAAAGDAKNDDKLWSDVVAATYSPDIGVAILKFDDYRHLHPGVGTKELDDFTEEAMDRLWWKRIAQLCTRRDARTKDLRAKDKELKEQPDGAFRKTLMDERTGIQNQLDRTQQILASDMGYTKTDSPDLDNKEMIENLTRDRDSAKYGAWKISTLKYIRNNHGATPWDGEG